MRLIVSRKQCELIERSLDEALRHGVADEETEIIETIKTKIAEALAPRKDR